jgi:glyoxylase-like metal-dependent hydrolase (beta-lactamase superfamily II)
MSIEHDAPRTLDTIAIGDVQITRVVEWRGPIAPGPEVFPDAPEPVWQRHADWLVPDFWDPRTTFFKANMQTWVLRSEGQVILVDTGLGDDKERPYAAPWAHLRTGFLERLAAAGVQPEDVDIVVNTHVHADHVGWNTQLVDGHWVPTFPRARYLIPEADFTFWNPLNGHSKRGSLGGINAALGNQNMFEDSVWPVHEHGQADLWEESHRIDGNLELEAMPGHTPGTSMLSLRSGSERALFVGDLLHSPLQFVEPHAEVCLSEDAPAAVRQRNRMLERAAETRALVLPAHLPGPGAAEVRREGATFAISHWAPFSPAR